jgi:hypothetical protein
MHSSPSDDLTNFEQFADVVHVDTQDEDYQEQIDEALGAGKQVFAYLSLCKGTKREERIDYLFDAWECDKMLIVDEDLQSSNVQSAARRIEGHDLQQELEQARFQEGSWSKSGPNWQRRKPTGKKPTRRFWPKTRRSSHPDPRRCWRRNGDSGTNIAFKKKRTLSHVFKWN